MAGVATIRVEVVTVVVVVVVVETTSTGKIERVKTRNQFKTV